MVQVMDVGCEFNGFGIGEVEERRCPGEQTVTG
jgi:hypothetical protein